MKYNYPGPGSSEETGPNRNFARCSHGSKASYMGKVCKAVSVHVLICDHETCRSLNAMIRSRIMAGTTAALK